MVFPRERLKLIGSRAEPFLLAVLDDPRYRILRDSPGPIGESAYETVVGLLADLQSERLVAHLTPAIASSNQRDRDLAVLSIATVGNQIALGPTLRAIGGQDARARRYAALGVERRVRLGGASSGFSVQVFEALARTAASSPALEVMGAVKCLWGMDAKRAFRLFQEEHVLRIGNPGLDWILRALNQGDAVVPPARLWPLIEQAKGKLDDEDAHDVYGELLVAIAGSPDDRAAREIDQATSSPEPSIRRGAADALLRLHGLPSAGWIAVSVRQRGEANASKPEMHVLALDELGGEVQNGGYGQYFVNCAGDRWPIALEASKAIGARHLESQIVRAAAVFGKSGPSLDRTMRLAQYAKLPDKRDETLDTLSEAYFKDRDRLDVCLARYIIDQRESIRERRRELAWSECW